MGLYFIFKHRNFSFYFFLILSQTLEHLISGYRPWPSDLHGERELWGKQRRGQAAYRRIHHRILCEY